MTSLSGMGLCWRRPLIRLQREFADEMFGAWPWSHALSGIAKIKKCMCALCVYIFICISYTNWRQPQYSILNPPLYLGNHYATVHKTINDVSRYSNPASAGGCQLLFILQQKVCLVCASLLASGYWYARYSANDYLSSGRYRQDFVLFSSFTFHHRCCSTQRTIWVGWVQIPCCSGTPCTTAHCHGN